MKLENFCSNIKSISVLNHEFSFFMIVAVVSPLAEQRLVCPAGVHTCFFYNMVTGARSACPLMMHSRAV